MTINLNESQVELLKSALVAYNYATMKELAKWHKEIDAKECVKSCEQDLKMIREIEELIY